jgi:hypothetical protein
MWHRGIFQRPSNMGPNLVRSSDVKHLDLHVQDFQANIKPIMTRPFGPADSMIHDLPTSAWFVAFPAVRGKQE